MIRPSAAAFLVLAVLLLPGVQPARHSFLRIPEAVEIPHAFSPSKGVMQRRMHAARNKLLRAGTDDTVGIDDGTIPLTSEIIAPAGFVETEAQLSDADVQAWEAALPAVEEEGSKAQGAEEVAEEGYREDKQTDPAVEEYDNEDDSEGEVGKASVVRARMHLQRVEGR